MQEAYEMQICSVGREDPPEEGMATHAWRIPWTEKPGGLRPTRSQRVGNDWSYLASHHISIPAWRDPWREKPGRLQSRGLQEAGHDWSDLACTHHHLGHCGLLWCSKESPGEPHFGTRASTQKVELPILFHGPKQVIWLHLTSSMQRCASPPGARRRVSSMDVDYIDCQQGSAGPGRPSGVMNEGFEL